MIKMVVDPLILSVIVAAILSCVGWNVKVMLKLLTHTTSANIRLSRIEEHLKIRNITEGTENI
jgi:hypothetical protein